MSDFDKEAERRRLREKYEEDESRRQETARMSELLLKGATMTNRHCDDCGAPIFRYQEQEFCPNCQGGGSGNAKVADANADAANGDAAGDAESAAADANAAVAEGDDAGNAAASNGVRSDRPTEAGGEATPVGNGAETGRASAAPPEADETVTPTAGAGRPRAPVESSPSSGDASPAGDRPGTVTEAREALLRAVTTHATRGESADDPRRAREHLAAAREAAEALSALDR